MPLAMMPLADRRGDVLAIAASMLLGFDEKHNAQSEFVWPTAEAIAALDAHDGGVERPGITEPRLAITFP